LYVANIGDAEALLAKNPTSETTNPFVVTTVKHKPTVPTEKKRIQVRSKSYSCRYCLVLTTTYRKQEALLSWEDCLACLFLARLETRN